MSTESHLDTKLQTCLRCGRDKLLRTFTDDRMHTHKVCNFCRDFMADRLVFLIIADKKFHDIAKVDCNVTQSYFKFLVNRNVEERKHLEEELTLLKGEGDHVNPKFKNW